MQDSGAGERKIMGPSLSCLRLNWLCIYFRCSIYNSGAPPRALSIFNHQKQANIPYRRRHMPRRKA